MSNPRDILLQLRDAEQRAWGDANWHYNNEASRRNELAEQAARDHRDKTQQLVDDYDANGSVRAALTALRSYRDHAEHWARQFRQWMADNEFDNAYAQWVHQQAAGGYQTCIGNLEPFAVVDVDGNIPPASQLMLLFGTDGDQDLTYEEELEIREGIDSSHDLSWEVKAKLMASAEAGGKLLGAKLKAKLGFDVEGLVRGVNTYKSSRMSVRKVKVTIHGRRPCYFYQLRTTCALKNAQAAELWGGYFSSSRRLVALR